MKMRTRLSARWVGNRPIRRGWGSLIPLLTALFTVLLISPWNPAPAQVQPPGLHGHPLSYDGTPTTDTGDLIRESRYLTMQDGINLAISIYRPPSTDQGARLPTILHQTRYWRSVQYRWPISILTSAKPRGLMGQYAERFLANGYVWVDVDVRGSGASFGTRPYAFSQEEIRDGAEIVDWIIRQPWSNGLVGAMGISYGGSAAELLLVNQHPAVKAVAPLFSGFDLYPEIAFPGGIHLRWFTKTWTDINRQLDQNRLPFSGWIANLLVRGVRPVDDDPSGRLLAQAISGHRNNWSPYREASGITFRDDVPPSQTTTTIDRLSPRNYAETIAKSGAAIYSYSGWFDGGYHLAAIKRFLTYHSSTHRLIIGPWDHGGKRNISPMGQGPSRFDHAGELLKFFDYHLKGLATGIADESPVHYYTMGEERWKAIDSWPPPARHVSFFFGDGFSLTPQAPLGEHGADRYVVDDTAGTGHQSRWDTLVGKPLTDPYPNRLAADEKLLTYTSPPLSQDTEVTGHPILTLYLRSSAADATIFAYLEDVDEDGHVTYVTEGELRALHRKLQTPEIDRLAFLPHRSYRRTDASPLVLGQTAKLVFDLLPTSYQFKRGHRLRLALAGRDIDHFAPLSQPTRPIWIIGRSRLHPSRLELPTAPSPQIPSGKASAPLP